MGNMYLPSLYLLSLDAVSRFLFFFNLFSQRMNKSKLTFFSHTGQVLGHFCIYKMQSKICPAFTRREPSGREKEVMKQLCFSMQVCRDLICPQHSDLQVHRDLPLSAFLRDNQIQITFCNYIIKHCNLFSFFSPLPPPHRLGCQCESFLYGDFSLLIAITFLTLNYPYGHKLLQAVSFRITLGRSWPDQMACRQVKHVNIYSSSFPALLGLHPQTRGTTGCEFALHSTVLCFDSQATITPANMMELQILK